MRRSRAWLVILCSTAVAATSGAAGPAPARDEDLFIRPEDQRTVLFGSLDGGRSVFASGGAKQTLTGPLDRTGFVAMEATGYGLTRERFRDGDVRLPATRLTYQAAVMAGFQWSLDGVFLATFVGPETHNEQLVVGGRVLRLAQPRVGARAQAELWAHPTPDLLVTATAVAGTTRASFYGRASAGVRVAGSAFVGPEVATYATPSYSEVRVGAHVTGPRLGLVSFRVSGGFMFDDAHRRGAPYGGLTAWVRL